MIIAGIGFSCLFRGGDRFSIPIAESGFEGSSLNLRKTKIVPTPDTAIDRQSNTVWCASFLAAWKLLEEDLAVEPSLQGSPEAVAALNRAQDPRPGIPDENLYAAAGWSQKGIIDRITKDLAQKFPSKAPPAFPGISSDSIVTYAYLETNLKFSLPYFQNRKPMVFTDCDGVKTELSSFGIRPEDNYAYFELRKQPRILYVARDEKYQVTECVIDLDRTSADNQIVLALVAPGSTLTGMLASIEEKIKTTEKKEMHDDLGPNDVLLVPDIVWHITHHYVELEGKEFTNSELKGQRIDIALQDIQFRLDRNGAELKSEDKTYMMPAPTYYVFNRPFIIYIKKRGAKIPYFVMRVENAELLTKWNVSKTPDKSIN